MLSSVLGFVAVILSATFGITSITNSLALVNRDIQEQNRSVIATSVDAKVNCVPASLASQERVRGLAVDLPRIESSSKRINFFDDGNSVTYRVAATPEAVADFYVQNGSKPCEGKSVALDDGLMVSKLANGRSVNVRIQSIPRSQSSSYVVYTLVHEASAVLGESTVKLAQDSGGMMQPPPPPLDSGTYSEPPSGMYTPPPTGDSGSYSQYSGTQPPPPPPGGTYPSGSYSGDHQYPSGQYPSGQYQNGQYPPPPGGQYPQQGMYQGTQAYPSNTNQPLPGGQDPNQQNQPGQYQGQPGMMGGQQGQFGKGQFGPPRLGGEAGQPGDQEEMEKQMQEQMLKDMQQHMGQFIKQIEMMKKRIPMMRKKLQACGADFPEELTNALGSIDGLIEKVKSAQDPEEAMMAMESLQDAAGVFQDLGPQMGDFMRYCEMAKQADREFKRLDREFARLESKAKTKKVDPGLLNDARSILNEMKESLANAKASAKTDIDESLDVIETGIFENMDNLREAMSTVNMALDITKGIKDADRTLADIDRKIKALERKKANVAEVKSLFAELKTTVVEIKEMAKGKIDPQALGDALQEALELREQIYDALQTLGGESTFIPQVKGEQGFEFKIHDSFLQGSQE